MVSLNQDFAALGTLHDGLFSKWKERAYASTPKVNIFSSLFLAQFWCPWSKSNNSNEYRSNQDRKHWRCACKQLTFHNSFKLRIMYRLYDQVEYQPRSQEPLLSKSLSWHGSIGHYRTLELEIFFWGLKSLSSPLSQEISSSDDSSVMSVGHALWKKWRNHRILDLIPTETYFHVKGWGKNLRLNFI